MSLVYWSVMVVDMFVYLVKEKNPVTQSAISLFSEAAIRRE